MIKFTFNPMVRRTYRVFDSEFDLFGVLAFRQSLFAFLAGACIAPCWLCFAYDNFYGAAFAGIVSAVWMYLTLSSARERESFVREIISSHTEPECEESDEGHG